MGQGGSKEGGSEEELFSGIRITPELLKQLSSKRLVDSQAQGSSQELGRPRVVPSQVRDVEAMINHSKMLQRALQRSDYINDMLLIREREEMIKIKSMAEDLIMREQSIHRKARPCLQESAACLQCYMDNPNDPTLCGDLANSYLKCAQAASDLSVRDDETSRIETIQ